MSQQTENRNQSPLDPDKMDNEAKLQKDRETHSTSRPSSRDSRTTVSSASPTASSVVSNAALISEILITTISHLISTPDPSTQDGHLDLTQAQLGPKERMADITASSDPASSCVPHLKDTSPSKSVLSREDISPLPDEMSCDTSTWSGEDISPRPDEMSLHTSTWSTEDFCPSPDEMSLRFENMSLNSSACSSEGLPECPEDICLRPEEMSPSTSVWSGGDMCLRPEEMSPSTQMSSIEDLCPYGEDDSDWSSEDFHRLDLLNSEETKDITAEETSCVSVSLSPTGSDRQQEPHEMERAELSEQDVLPKAHPGAEEKITETERDTICTSTKETSSTATVSCIADIQAAENENLSSVHQSTASSSPTVEIHKEWFSVQEENRLDIHPEGSQKVTDHKHVIHAIIQEFFDSLSEEQRWELSQDVQNKLTDVLVMAIETNACNLSLVSKQPSSTDSGTESGVQMSPLELLRETFDITEAKQHLSSSIDEAFCELASEDRTVSRFTELIVDTVTNKVCSVLTETTQDSPDHDPLCATDRHSSRGKACKETLGRAIQALRSRLRTNREEKENSKLWSQFIERRKNKVQPVSQQQWDKAVQRTSENQRSSELKATPLRGQERRQTPAIPEPADDEHAGKSNRTCHKANKKARIAWSHEDVSNNGPSLRKRVRAFFISMFCKRG